MKTIHNFILLTLRPFSASEQIIDSAIAIIPFDDAINEALSNTTPIVDGTYIYMEDHLGNPNNTLRATPAPCVKRYGKFIRITQK